LYEVIELLLLSHSLGSHAIEVRLYLSLRACVLSGRSRGFLVR
jgi:hypothetical protein